MIGALGGMGDGSWGSTDPNAVGGANNQAKPNTITSGVSLNVLTPWTRSDMLMAAARTSVAGSYKQDAAAQRIAIAPVATVRAPAPPPTGPSTPVIVGAAAVGLGALAFVIYKLRKRS